MRGSGVEYSRPSPDAPVLLTVRSGRDLDRAVHIRPVEEADVLEGAGFRERHPAALGSGVPGKPAVSGVWKNPLPWFAPS